MTRLARAALKRPMLWLALLLLAAAAAAVLHPSQQVHDDAFDELRDVEGPYWWANSKHPLSEVSLWWVLRGLRSFGYAGRSLGVAQVSNAMCLALALAAVGALLMRAVGPWLAFFVTALLALTFGSLHFALDPYLFYWPPSLAAFSWATWLTVTSRRSRGAALAVLLGVVACCENPMMVGAIAALGVTHYLLRKDGASWRTWVEAVALSALPLAVLALWESHLDRAPLGVLYGRWRADAAGASFEALRSVLVASIDDTRGDAGLAEGASFVVLAAVALRVGRRRVGLPLVLATLAHGTLVAWWDPGQLFFWLLVPWLLVLAWAVSESVGNRDRAFEFALLPLVGIAAVAVGLQNGRSYLAYGLGPSPEKQRELRDARSFRPGDLLVFRESGQLELEYRAGLRTAGWTSIYGDRTPGASSFAMLLRYARAMSDTPGYIYLELDEDWQPAYAKEPVPGVPTDLSPRDFMRVVWGPVRRLGARRLRQIADIVEELPCERPPERAERGVGVRASGADEAALNDLYAAFRAVDGDRNKEWLAPGGQRAWVDLYFEPPRSAKHVFLLNAKNPGYADRGTLAYQVDVIGPEQARSFTGVYPGHMEHEKALRIPVEGKVSCVRAWVLGWSGLGGGFAEIWLD